MKKFPLMMLGLVLASIIFSMPTQGYACSINALSNRHKQPISTSRPNNRLFNEAVLHYINRERCRNNRVPFKSDSRLVTMAAGHSSGMARTSTFSHHIARSGYETMARRLKRSGLRFNAAAENIARNYVYVLSGRPISAKSAGPCKFYYSGSGQQVPKHSYQSLAREVVSQWMNSSGHRRNIMDRRFSRTGAAFGVDPSGRVCGEVYLTQNFAN